MAEHIGRYRLGAVLRTGSFRTVYRARDRRSNREVAVMVMRRDLAVDAGALLRARDTARRARDLDHPNIVPVLDSGVHEGCYYLVEELIGGETLDVRLQRRPHPPVADIRRVAIAIARALQAAHRRLIVHGPIRTSDIHLAEDGTVMLGGFGAVSVIEGDAVAESVVASASRHDEFIAGRRSDLSGLGAVIYEMLRGGPPTRRGRAVAADASKDVDAPGTVDATFAPIVARLLAIDPASGYASADELLTDLDLDPSESVTLIRAAGRDNRRTLREHLWDLFERRKRREVLIVALAFGLTVPATGAAALLMVDQTGSARLAPPPTASSTVAWTETVVPPTARTPNRAFLPSVTARASPTIAVPSVIPPAPDNVGVVPQPAAPPSPAGSTPPPPSDTVVPTPASTATPTLLPSTPTPKATPTTVPSPTVAPPPTPVAIVNGGFEAGSLSGWTAAGTTAVTRSAPHSGAYTALLGSSSPTDGDSSLSQTFAAPSGATTLSFWYAVYCPDGVSSDWATASLRDNTAGTTTTVLDKTCTNGAGWNQVSAPVTAGHAYTLTLVSHDENYPGDPTYTTYDDVSVS